MRHPTSFLVLLVVFRVLDDLLRLDGGAGIQWRPLNQLHAGYTPGQTLVCSLSSEPPPPPTPRLPLPTPALSPPSSLSSSHHHHPPHWCLSHTLSSTFLSCRRSLASLNLEKKRGQILDVLFFSARWEHCSWQRVSARTHFEQIVKQVRGFSFLML